MNKRLLLLTLIASLQSHAVTMHNQLASSINYTIYTNGTLTVCATGKISGGEKVVWDTAGSIFQHPLCGGTTGPTHVEIHMSNAYGLTTICLQKQTNDPRIINSSGRVLVKWSKERMECHTL